MIRIAIGAMPSLLRSIVRSALETRRDMAVVAASEPCGPRGGAEVLIVCSDREPDECIAVRHLIAAGAPTIVAIDTAGVRATILRVTVESMPIGAAADLCEAVRLAAGSRLGAAN